MVDLLRRAQALDERLAKEAEVLRSNETGHQSYQPVPLDHAPIRELAAIVRELVEAHGETLTELGRLRTGLRMAGVEVTVSENPDDKHA